MSKRKHDKSNMSTPAGASQFKAHATRQTLAYDAYGARTTFIVRVLTRPIPMNANDFKTVMAASDADSALWEVDATIATRIVFMGRILQDEMDAPSPHSTLPDPCQDWTIKTKGGVQPGCAAKIVSWHTRFFSRSDYNGKVPGIGDKVRVTLSTGDFKYNLQNAYFETLESVELADSDESCQSSLEALFKGFDHTQLGEIVDLKSAPGGKPGTGKCGAASTATANPFSQTDCSYASVPSPGNPRISKANLPRLYALNKDLFKFIGAGEGDYEAVNPPGLVGAKAAAWAIANLPEKKPITELTISQILAHQKGKKGTRVLGAVGFMQWMPPTFKSTVAGVPVASGAKFSATTQQEMAASLVFKRRPWLSGYILGTHDKLCLAMYDFALEWASMPMPAPGAWLDGVKTKLKGGSYQMAKVKRGQGAYSCLKKAHNSVGHAPGKVAHVLKAARNRMLNTPEGKQLRKDLGL